MGLYIHTLFCFCMLLCVAAFVLRCCLFLYVAVEFLVLIFVKSALSRAQRSKFFQSYIYRLSSLRIDWCFQTCLFRFLDMAGKGGFLLFGAFSCVALMGVFGCFLRCCGGLLFCSFEKIKFFINLYRNKILVNFLFGCC